MWTNEKACIVADTIAIVLRCMLATFNLKRGGYRY